MKRKSPAELRLVRWFASFPNMPILPDEGAAKVLEIIAEKDTPTMRDLILEAVGDEQAVNRVVALLANPTDEMFDALPTDKQYKDLTSREVFTAMASALRKPVEDYPVEPAVDEKPEDAADPAGPADAINA